MLDSISIFRIIKTGFVNFWRNLWLSAAATMVMVITLVIFSVLFIMFTLTTYSINVVQNMVDMSVYLNTEVPDAQALNIKEELQQDSRVIRVVYKTPEQVRQEFILEHQDNEAIVEALKEYEDNIFGGTFNVQTQNLQDYDSISKMLKSDKYKPYVRDVNYEDNKEAINRLNKILDFIVSFGIGLVLIFSVIAILVIFNTITLTIYNRKEEVEIMRLVGATNWYIRGPFLTESALYSIFATIISGLIFYPVFKNVLPRISLFMSSQVTLFNTNIFNFWYLIIILFLVSVVLAVFSTLLAIRKYLKI